MGSYTKLVEKHMDEDGVLFYDDETYLFGEFELRLTKSFQMKRTDVIISRRHKKQEEVLRFSDKDVLQLVIDTLTQMQPEVGKHE